MTRAAYTALACCLLPSLASADAIPPPEPIECRPGEEVVNDHGGTRCELPYCESSSDCPEGTDCPPMRCVGWVPSGQPGCEPEDGSKEPPDPCDPVPEDRGPCRDAEPRCDEGERCTRQQCVWREEQPAPTPAPEPADTASEPASPPPSGSGGGCCGSRGATSAAWPGALFGALALVVVGRRRSLE